MVKRNIIEYQEVKGSQNLIRMLGRNVVDCILMEEKAFEYQLKKMKRKGIYDAGGRYLEIKKGAVTGVYPIYSARVFKDSHRDGKISLLFNVHAGI